jgi:transmembrane sensor
MKEEEYKGYSLEELLEDQDFVNQIISIQTNEEWEKFLQANISAKSNIIQARKIIQIFRISEGKLRDETKFNLWKNVNDFNKNFSGKRKIARLNVFVRYAASFLIILAIGRAIYWRYSVSDNQYSFAKIESVEKTNNPILVLANKEKIELASDKESNIVVLKNQDAILVNNDSIIQNTPQQGTAQNAFNEITVPYGKKVMLQLSDGTKVQLNAGSRFAFPQTFNGRNREVYLAGEGYFEVTKNEKQPFIVSTSEVDVKVLGTKFNLSAYSSDNICETVLLEGKVEIQEKGRVFNDRINLMPNQKAMYFNDTKQLIKSEAPDAGMYVTWTNGWYNFSNENIVRVLEKLERFYNVKFIYDKSIIEKALPISGKLDLKDSMQEVMGVLSDVAKIDYKMSNENIVITMKKH